MDVDVIKLLDLGYAWTGERVATVRPEHLDAPTTCPEWNVRELINHLLGAMTGIAAVAAGESDPGQLKSAASAHSDQFGQDPAPAFAAVSARALQVWHTPGVLGRTCAMSFGPTPAATVAGIATMDAVVHGWDIARSTGENADIPAELAEPLLAVSRQLIQPSLRGGAFAEEVRIEAGSASDRLVAFLGRTP